MIRFIKRLILTLILLVAVLLAPVGYTELACRGEPDKLSHADAILPPDRHRPVTRTLTTYPEWHIVHAYDDYAKVIETGDPHDFAFFTAIRGFWSSLCAVKVRAESFEPVDNDTKLMVYTIGVSFTAELALKAAYEETIGRLFTVLRGPHRAPLDDLSAEEARAYATFLQQVPWYKWDFRADADKLHDEATDALRDKERSMALGLEYRAKAAYAGVIADAVAAVGPDELTLRMVVTGLTPAQLARFEGVTVIDTRPEGVEIETPRYRTLTHLIVDMAVAGANLVEIAGNDTIMLTATGAQAAPDAMFTFDRQGYGDKRNLILLPVTGLADWLRANPGAVEHIHDY